ncbi:hypothetical protein [Flavobacterium sp. KACC 22761]|uniref:hypothetical protein n=1 Tax=Flavobacterium sp. KACC 22761 TaxID=3092665 RepID=UPI002A74A483|nr:hypothetical protein [Flavobacterium sp. KACC 22761]WPO78944.1 hypothetical protein SCB73_00845 [Flavobacterium sp. KACC 22761]
MRKIIVFLVFMNLLLSGGGQYLNANTFDGSQHHLFEKKHRVKFTHQERGTSLIEDADIDLGEDLSGNDDLNDGLSGKLIAVNYSLLDSWYLTFSDQSAINESNRFKIYAPFLAHSNPIYITQRVLRI